MSHLGLQSLQKQASYNPRSTSFVDEPDWSYHWGGTLPYDTSDYAPRWSNDKPSHTSLKNRLKALIRGGRKKFGKREIIIDVPRSVAQATGHSKVPLAGRKRLNDIIGVRA